MPVGGACAEELLHYGKLSTWPAALRRLQDYSPQGVILAWWVPFWSLHFGWLVRHLPDSLPAIFICHNVLPHESRIFDPLLTRRTLKRASRFIVHSQEDRQQLLKWFPHAHVIGREHPIYSIEASQQIPREQARQAMNIRGKMLLFFGFVRPYKGLDVALEALARVREQLPDLRLWISGEFWESEKPYWKRVHELGLEDRVVIEARYLTEQDLALRLGACDGVILPYKSATGSGVLATAYAHLRPVIATRTGCFRDMVSEGNSGILCDPGDPGSLAQAILEFYAGPGPARFAGGVEQAIKQFSWEGILEAIEELLTDA